MLRKREPTPDQQVWQEPGVTSEDFRVTEMRWLESHREELACCYPGEWIAVEGTELVAHARDLMTLMQLAAEKGHPNPFVTAVPEEPIDSLHL